jgi:SNF2 family DNA or RNA helicase
VGQDLAFWTTVLRFAGSLVARQQFLPGLMKKQEIYRACWEPVLGGAEAERVAQLSKGMPAVARALSQQSDSPPVDSASSVLTRFLTLMVDWLVRSTLVDTTPPSQLETKQKRGRSDKKSAAGLNSLHDRWLHALRTADGIMAGKDAEFAQLAEQIHDWRRPVAASTNTPFRLCFRLEEPDNETETEGEPSSVPSEDRLSPMVSSVAHLSAGQDTNWYVRYLLQAADDPSLLVPIQEAWATKGRMASLLKRRGGKVQEYALSALGQAAGISAEIEQSLQGALPGGYHLNTVGAHAFLTEQAMVLEQAGFGVMLPAWWTRKGTKLRLTAHARVKSPKMQGGGGLSLDEIVQFDWEVALGDEKLSLQELRMLAKLKTPLVQVRGQWVEMHHEEIQAAVDFWKKKANQSGTVREVMRMALGATSTTGGIAFGSVKATGWIADLLAELEGQTPFQELPVPDQFHGRLRPYQVRGYSWLSFLRQWGLGACLADDMGLGKTPQTLALIQMAWLENPSTSSRPTLVVCPTSVINNWQKEAARFTPDLPVLIHHGAIRTKGATFTKAARKQAIVISSYALLHRDLDHFKEVEWGGLILDEAQNVKNPETLQAKAARSLRAEAHIALTGTPVENNVGDLWSIMEFLNPGYLGTQAEFKRKFFIPIQANQDPEAAVRLKRLTGPFILRRLKTDRSIITDLPEKQEMKVFCTLTKEQASLYAAVAKDAEAALTGSEGIQRKGVVLATISKLKQVCNHPAQFLGDHSAIPGRSGKLARLTEMLEEMLTIGDRALIFTQFAEMGTLLQRHLQETFGREVLFLHGRVSKKQRDQMVSRFQADGVAGEHDPDGATVNRLPIFILSLKAGGTGLNLTQANHVFHFDRWWNPAVENQATDRAFRIGQTKNVQVHKYICAGTLEEKIDEMIEHKKAVAEQVVGTGEGWLTELSNEQLKELFTLRAEAVGA